MNQKTNKLEALPHTGINQKKSLLSYLSISRPGKGSALRWLGLAAGADYLLSQLINNDFALQILQRMQGHQQRSGTEPERHFGTILNKYQATQSNGGRVALILSGRQRSLPEVFPSICALIITLRTY